MGQSSIASREHGSSLNRFTTVLLIGYLAFIVLFMVLRRAAPSPDVFVVFVSVIAVMLGRGRAFVRDWAPFLLIFLAWEAMRGIANQFGAAVHSDAVIAVERFIAFGHVLPVWLQQTFYHHPHIGPLEISMAAVYAAHFVLPLAVAFVLWVRQRTAYYHYVIALMLMSFAQFVTAVLLPVAPPRFSGQYGEALPIVDIGGEVARQTGIGVISWVYHSHDRQPGGSLPLPARRISDPRFPFPAPILAAMVLPDAGLQRRGLVRDHVPGPPLPCGRAGWTALCAGCLLGGEPVHLRAVAAAVAPLAPAVIDAVMAPSA